MDRIPPAARRALFWTLLVSAATAALLSVLFQGRVHQVLLLVVTVAAPAAALVPKLGAVRDVPPPPRWLRVVQAVTTLLYNGGWMLLVFLVLSHWVPVDVSPTALALLALWFVPYLALLGVASDHRAATAGLRATWYTRAHGAYVLAAAAATGALAGVLLTGPDTLLGIATGSTWPLALAQVAVLAAGTQLMLAGDLPTLLDLTQRALHRGPEEETDTPPIVYAALLALGAILVVAFIVSQFGLTRRFGGFGQERAIYFIILIPVGLAAFFLASALLVWRESRRGLYKKKITTKLRNDLLVYGFAAVAGGVGVWLLFQHMTGALDYIGPLNGEGLRMDLIAYTVVVTLGPIGIYLHRQSRRTDEVEERLPDFLNDLAETRRAGLTLTAAVQSVAKADYGALSPELRTMAVQVGWGVPFTEALRQMADRVDTALARRASHLVIEASRTGGSVAEVLKAAAQDAYELKGLESDRRSTMMTYLVVIYVVFAVFLVVLAVLQSQFIPEVLGAAELAEESPAGIEFIKGEGNVDLLSVQAIYYNAAIVQAIGNGIVGGILSEGRVSAGLRHVAYMTAFGWAVFRLLMGA